MPHITLAVTRPVIEQVSAGNEFQRQLAIQGSSENLAGMIMSASRQNLVQISICGVFDLIVGDTGAIWLSHQAAGTQTDDFLSFYELLARRPDFAVTFTW